MKRNLKTCVSGPLAIAVVCLLAVASASGQARPQAAAPAAADKPLLAEQAFKDVQLLRGISVKEFMETMGFFSAATNGNCTFCHGEESASGWNNYAVDTPLKQTARKMIVMMNAINASYFGGQRKLTCYSCHRNANVPMVTPTLAEQYATPILNDVKDITEQAPDQPTPDQVFDKYLQALGGAKRVAGFTSFVAKGTYQGYDDPVDYPVEVYAKAPGQFSQVVHGANGDSSWVDDGRNAWVAQSILETPVPVVSLTAGDLDGAHLEAQLYFPARIKQLVTKLRVGFPIKGTMSMLSDADGSGIDNRQLTVMQGVTAAGNEVRLYFDTQTGLLARMVRFTNLPIGFINTEMDYSDYRDVSGLKIPFRITKTWVDGRSVTLLNSVQINAPVDASKFAKPTAPKEASAALR
jgi:photosynthetic reaction center cytochrome c subunit